MVPFPFYSPFGSEGETKKKDGRQSQRERERQRTMKKKRMKATKRKMMMR